MTIVYENCSSTYILHSNPSGAFNLRLAVRAFEAGKRFEGADSRDVGYLSLPPLLLLRLSLKFLAGAVIIREGLLLLHAPVVVAVPPSRRRRHRRELRGKGRRGCGSRRRLPRQLALLPPLLVGFAARRSR